VNVSTRRFVDHVNIPKRTHIYLKSPESSASTTPNAFKTIHTTAYADFTLPSPADQPNNDTKLDALAAKIASDFYASLEHNYDRTFIGIKSWDTSGYDDHVLYQFGGEFPQPKLSAITSVNGGSARTNIETRYDKWAHTRVQSAPLNFGEEQQLSQDPDLRPLASTQFGQLIEDLEVDGIATFAVWEYDDIDDRSSPNQGHTTTNIELEVWDFFELAMPDATRGQVIFDFESERWYMLKGAPADAAIFTAATTGPWVSASIDTVPVSHEGSPLDVNLPKVGIGTGKPGKDPNLATGDVIVYTFTEGGDAYCVSDYSDDPIGTVKMWIGTTSNIPFGWRDLSWDGLIPVGVDTTQTSDPDISVIGTGNTLGSMSHTHQESGEATGHLVHSGGAGVGLDHNDLVHSADDTNDLNGLTHRDIPHEDSPLTHAVGTGDDSHVPDGTEEIQDHVLTDHLYSHEDNDHNIDDHDMSSAGHTVADHVIEVERHYPSMMPVIFIERFHE
jgi:hypothetical protein